ncbi:MAG TPA: choice-of-anchor tandem repeat GloVer-containing protein [Rhizomicrobium sp.]|nr:choice-of-anchor tandem repeat GloVer-containing protein [Rhizomicrobium sp.]
MKSLNRKLCALAGTIALSLALATPIQAKDSLAQSVSVKPNALWPIATAVFNGSIYFISSGGPNSCGGLYELVLNESTGKDEAKSVHQFSATAKAGCNPVGLTIANINGTDLLVVTTDFDGANGTGGLFLMTAAATKQVSFPADAQSPVGTAIIAVTSAAKSPRGLPQFDFMSVFKYGGDAGFGDVVAALLFLSGGALNDLGPAIKVGPFSSAFSFPGGAGGQHPGSPAVQGPDGNLYGTTQAGGSTNGSCATFNGCGIVYQLTPPVGSETQWNEDVLYTFQGAPDFQDPYASVTFDASGNVIGTAAFGGTGSFGGVFLLTKQTTYPWPLTALYTFPNDYNEGAAPEAGVSLDSKGNVFGATLAGGPSPNPYGVVFELKKSATYPWKESILQAFHGGKRGANPSGAPLLYLGDIYGTTYGGGKDTTGGACPGGGSQDVQPGCGTVFELAPK